MNKDDATRLTKLRDLLDKLKRGETVQNRQLRTWLGEDGYKEYEEGWSNLIDFRNDLTSKPSDLVEYEAMLRTAILFYNRGESASARGNHKNARKFHARSQVEFEHALSRLREMIHDDPSLTMWLDRHCDFTAGGNLSLSPSGVPRVITSRSLDKQGSGGLASFDSKRRFKIRSVEDEIDKILNPRPKVDEVALLEKLHAIIAESRKW